MPPEDSELDPVSGWPASASAPEEEPLDDAPGEPELLVPVPDDAPELVFGPLADPVWEPLEAPGPDEELGPAG